eukprot:6533344-Pyramimonas_sp.AAC.1
MRSVYIRGESAGPLRCTMSRTTSPRSSNRAGGRRTRSTPISGNRMNCSGARPDAWPTNAES